VFDELALKIAGKMGFEYNGQEAENSKQYLRWVHSLGKDV
jgi:hypothetical protein